MKLHRHLPLWIAGVVALAVGGALLARAVSASGRAEAPDDPAPAAPALTVATERPQRIELPLALAANGSVAAWQEASIGAEAAGLRLASVLVNVGDVVKRGQVLATFAPEGPQADLAQVRAAVAEAEAAAADAAANAARVKPMAEAGAMSEQQVRQYLTAEQTALARVEAQRAAARAQALRLAHTEVRASDDGVISARLATVGAVVPAGQELFRLIRGGRLEWRAELTPAELVKLAPGTPAQIAAADGSTVAGRVRQVAPTVDGHTRTGFAYVDLEASGALKAGMYASGRFELGRSAALTVPQAALVVRDGSSYVFRVNPDGRVAQQKVRVGRRSADRVEVLEGLAPDAAIVASGAGFLDDGDRVQVAARPAAPVQATAMR